MDFLTTIQHKSINKIFSVSLKSLFDPNIIYMYFLVLVLKLLLPLNMYIFMDEHCTLYTLYWQTDEKRIRFLFILHRGSVFCHFHFSIKFLCLFHIQNYISQFHANFSLLKAIVLVVSKSLSRISVDFPFIASMVSNLVSLSWFDFGEKKMLSLPLRSWITFQCFSGCQRKVHSIFLLLKYKVLWNHLRTKFVHVKTFIWILSDTFVSIPGKLVIGLVL